MPPARSSRSARAADMVAVVDLGSNSFHLLVARLDHGQPHILERLQEMVRLAAGIDAQGRLDKATTRRALDCLARFGERLRGIPTANVRAVATATLRRAQNSAGFLTRGGRTLRGGSRHIGCVPQSTTPFADGRIARRRGKQAEPAARLEFKPIEAQFRNRG